MYFPDARAFLVYSCFHARGCAPVSLFIRSRPNFKLCVLSVAMIRNSRRCYSYPQKSVRTKGGWFPPFASSFLLTHLQSLILNLPLFLVFSLVFPFLSPTKIILKTPVILSNFHHVLLSIRFCSSHRRWSRFSNSTLQAR